MRRFAETPLMITRRYSYGDHLTLRLFCRLFGVSKTTASIRLRQLGYMVDPSIRVSMLTHWRCGNEESIHSGSEPTPELIEKIRRARLPFPSRSPDT
ncbi:MAG: hypothetical protein ACLS5Z_06380 [Clostridium fessum]